MKWKRKKKAYRSVLATGCSVRIQAVDNRFELKYRDLSGHWSEGIYFRTKQEAQEAAETLWTG